MDVFRTFNQFGEKRTRAIALHWLLGNGLPQAQTETQSDRFARSWAFSGKSDIWGLGGILALGMQE
ncbi:MAG: hypothetical protein AB1861_05785 [Cyanobacteriota bacterium]